MCRHTNFLPPFAKSHNQKSCQLILLHILSVEWYCLFSFFFVFCLRVSISLCSSMDIYNLLSSVSQGRFHLWLVFD